MRAHRDGVTIFSTTLGMAAGERRNVPLAFLTLPMTLAILAVGWLPSSRALAEGPSHGSGSANSAVRPRPTENAPPTALQLLIPATERQSTTHRYAEELSAALVPLNEKIRMANVYKDLEVQIQGLQNRNGARLSCNQAVLWVSEFGAFQSMATRFRILWEVARRRMEARKRASKQSLPHACAYHAAIRDEFLAMIERAPASQAPDEADRILSRFAHIMGEGPDRFVEKLRQQQQNDSDQDDCVSALARSLALAALETPQVRTIAAAMGISRQTVLLALFGNGGRENHDRALATIGSSAEARLAVIVGKFPRLESKQRDQVLKTLNEHFEAYEIDRRPPMVTEPRVFSPGGRVFANAVILREALLREYLDRRRDSIETEERIAMNALRDGARHAARTHEEQEKATRVLQRAREFRQQMAALSGEVNKRGGIAEAQKLSMAEFHSRFGTIPDAYQRAKSALFAPDNDGDPRLASELMTELMCGAGDWEASGKVIGRALAAARGVHRSLEDFCSTEASGVSLKVGNFIAGVEWRGASSVAGGNGASAAPARGWDISLLGGAINFYVRRDDRPARPVDHGAVPLDDVAAATAPERRAPPTPSPTALPVAAVTVATPSLEQAPSPLPTSAFGGEVPRVVALPSPQATEEVIRGPLPPSAESHEGGAAPTGPLSLPPAGFVRGPAGIAPASVAAPSAVPEAPSSASVAPSAPPAGTAKGTTSVSFGAGAAGVAPAAGSGSPPPGMAPQASLAAATSLGTNALPPGSTNGNAGAPGASPPGAVAWGAGIGAPGVPGAGAPPWVYGYLRVRPLYDPANYANLLWYESPRWRDSAAVASRRGDFDRTSLQGTRWDERDEEADPLAGAEALRIRESWVFLDKRTKAVRGQIEYRESDDGKDKLVRVAELEPTSVGAPEGSKRKVVKRRTERVTEKRDGSRVTVVVEFEEEYGADGPSPRVKNKKITITTQPKHGVVATVEVTVEDIVEAGRVVGQRTTTVRDGVVTVVHRRRNRTNGEVGKVVETTVTDGKPMIEALQRLQNRMQVRRMDR